VARPARAQGGNGEDDYEKTAWLKGQRFALDLQQRMAGLVSRGWAVQHRRPAALRRARGCYHGQTRQTRCLVLDLEPVVAPW
jgi:hypothetical protein